MNGSGSFSVVVVVVVVVVVEIGVGESGKVVDVGVSRPHPWYKQLIASDRYNRIMSREN